MKTYYEIDDTNYNRLGNKISKICMCDESDDIPEILKNQKLLLSVFQIKLAYKEI